MGRSASIYPGKAFLEMDHTSRNTIYLTFYFWNDRFLAICGFCGIVGEFTIKDRALAPAKKK